MTIEAKALALFMHNHQDAEPALVELAWLTDPQLRAFWTEQVKVVLGLAE